MSTWSKCGRGKETAFTHKHLGQKKQEETSQLGYIVGTGRRDDDVYICNDVRLWDTWDHYRYMPGYRKKSKQKVFQKERERRSGQDGNQRQMSKKTESEKKVMEGDEDKIEEDSAVIF